MSKSIKTFASVLIVLPMLLIPLNADAQTLTPPVPTPAIPTGNVSGTIINNNQDTAVSESLEIMLHGWDQNYAMQVMVHGESETDGSFLFDEVNLEPGIIYAVMVTYEDAQYYSDYQLFEADQNIMYLDVLVYESTSDLTDIQADQMHIVFYASQGGLGVTEIYIISNLGDRTVQEVEALDEGGFATLSFPLPAEAVNISFDTDDDNRFVTLPGGFADTAPLIPGTGSTQIYVSYILPYTSGMSYSYTAPLIINKVNLLLMDDFGISIEAENLPEPEELALQGGTTGIQYSYNELQVNENIEITLSGEIVFIPSGGMPGESVTDTQNQSSSAIGTAGVILGVVIVGVGLWWQRQPEKELFVTEGNELSLENIITEIALLENAFEKGEVDDEYYLAQGAELRQIAKKLIDEEKSEA